MISRDPGGLIPRIFSWIPIYTPAVMLARLESGVSSFELAGTAAVLLAFGAIELFALGRLFETNLIQTRSSFALKGFSLKGNIRRPLVYAVVIILVAGVIVMRRRLKAPAKTDSQTADIRAHGEALFRKSCAECHEPAVGRAPGVRQLASFPPADIVKSLASGTMKPMAAGMNAADINAIAAFLAGHEPSFSSGAAAPDPPAVRTQPIQAGRGGLERLEHQPR